MKNIRRTLAVLLCLLMLVTTVPFAVAEEPVSEPTCEHSYGDFIPMNDATCIANGHEAATCSLCGNRVVREIPDSALGHTDLDLSDWQYPEGYDCAAGGIRFKECARCGELTVVETLEPHTPVEVIDPGVERIPCERDGKSAGIHCDVCGKVILSPVIEPAHTFEETVVKEATCLTEGEIQRVCADCGESISAVTPPTGHTDEDENGICDVCEQPLGGQTDPISGQCGDNVYWSYDAETATLTISGEGEMWDYYDGNPWSEFDYITTVVIEDGVTSIGGGAFQGCSELTSVTIPDSVTSIGAAAFFFCNSLTSLTIPDSVTSIGDTAFGYCSGLTNVTIPDSVTSIGDFAFTHCSSLSSFVVDDGNESYSSDDYGCLLNKDKTILIKYPIGNPRENFVVSDSITKIEKNAFHHCSNLKSVEIPDSVTSIGRYAFGYCSSLTSVTIPDSVTSIGDSAFEYCSSLTSVTIPNSVTSIGNWTLEGCSSLTSVTIPDSVTNIGEHAFEGCSGLTSVTIPDSVTNIGGHAFEGCSGLTSVTIPDGVISIEGATFYYCSSLTSVTIPDSVTSIESGAFSYCKSLTSVTIPDSVTSIGGSAFQNCGSLMSVTIPASVTSIGNVAFGNCGNLMNVTIMNPNCEIAQYENTFPEAATICGYPGSTAQAYAETYGRTFVALCQTNHADTTDDPGQSATCTEDGYTAGVYCNDCEQWIEGHEVIPAGHKDADGDFLCDNCGADLVRSIHVDETLTVDITGGALTYLRFVPEETATYTLTSLSDSDTYGYLFDSEMNELDANDDDADSNFRLTNTLDAGETYYYGVRLYQEKASGSFDVSLIKESVHSGQCGDNATWKLALPSGEMRIEGEGALWSDDESNAPWANYMSEIKTVKIDDGITNIPANAFFGAYKLKRVEFPSALKTIGSYAFFFCTHLQSADLPDGLESIGICAFEGCTTMEDVRIPDSVQTIGDLAFAICASLKSVVLPKSLTAIEQGMFWQCYHLESVTIPASVTTINGTGEASNDGNISPFTYCFNLKTITNYSATAVTASTVFDTLSVPENVNAEDCLKYSIVYAEAGGLFEIGIFPADTIEAYVAQRLKEEYGSDYQDILQPTIDAIQSGDASIDSGYPADLVFRCFSDSAEYAYCSENSVPYVLLDRGQCGDDVYFSFDRSSGKLTISGTGAMWDSNPNYGYVHVWQDAFQDSYKNEIQTVVIEDGVTSIGAISFDGCSSLTSVTISDSVTMIDDIAFYECDALTDVYYLGTEAQWNQIDIHNDFEGNAALLNASIHFIVTDSDTDVSLTYDADVFDADVEIDITEIPTGDDHSRAWNITPTLNGEKVQPNAPVLVKLPIPTGWDKTKIVLTHTKADGTVEYPEFTIEGDYVVFWATEFSEYALKLQTPHIHTYDDGVVTKAATCKEEGVKTFTCVDGDDSYTVPIPVNPDNHADYGTHVVNARGASCDHAGYTGDTVCNGCGKTVAKGSAIPTTDHSDSNNDGHCDACGRQMEGGDHCPQCGKVHNEFLIGWLIGIIHRIVYRLTHLFG